MSAKATNIFYKHLKTRSIHKHTNQLMQFILVLFYVSEQPVHIMCSKLKVVISLATVAELAEPLTSQIQKLNQKKGKEEEIKSRIKSSIVALQRILILFFKREHIPLVVIFWLYQADSRVPISKEAFIMT